MIVPEPGEMKRVINELLGLADRSTDVEYVMWPEPALRVPEELAGRFVKLREALSQPTPGDDESTPESEPAKRKPGRPKKIVEA